MTEGKGQRKFPIPAGFTWSHTDDCYVNDCGDRWNPDTNLVTRHEALLPKEQAQTPVQTQQESVTPVQTQQESVEQQIVRLQATAPRVTPADVQAAIRNCYYFTALEGIQNQLRSYQDETALGLLTICVIVLQNGFTVIGKSACASSDNYRREIGERVAREDAERQIWPLLGFELRQILQAQSAAGIKATPGEN